MLNWIVRVINGAIVPTFVGTVPSRFGEPGAGTLKADEWRWLSTFYLPVALILKWGSGTSHPSPDIARLYRRVLDFTMRLVEAMILTCKRYQSRGRAQSYLDLYTDYMRLMDELFPHIKAKPSHHAAFHIYDFIILFGPLYSWWCFPFERVIGILQRIPQNHKKGEFTVVLCP